MSELTLFSKEDCPLCTAAEQRIKRVLADVSVEVVNIVGDRELEDQYIFRIPVLVNDGVVLSEGCISEAELIQILNSLRASVSAGSN